MDRKCQALKCKVIIKKSWAFCEIHWALLEQDVRDELAAAYTAGQCKNIGLKTSKWHRAISKARYMIKEASND
jgi:hypothetical protein